MLKVKKYGYLISQYLIRKDLCIINFNIFNIIEILFLLINIHIFIPRGDLSVDQSGIGSTSCILLHNGTIQCAAARVYTTHCPADFANWPYDKHNCTLHFGSWMHFSDEMNFDFGSDSVIYYLNIIIILNLYNILFDIIGIDDCIGMNFYFYRL